MNYDIQHVNAAIAFQTVIARCCKWHVLGTQPPPRMNQLWQRVIAPCGAPTSLENNYLHLFQMAYHLFVMVSRKMTNAQWALFLTPGEVEDLRPDM